MLFKLIFWYGRYSVIHIFHIYIYTFDIIRCPSTTSIALPIHRILIWESKFDDKCCEFFRLINSANWQSPVWPARPVPALNIWVVLLTAGMPGGREGGRRECLVRAQSCLGSVLLHNSLNSQYWNLPGWQCRDYNNCWLQPVCCTIRWTALQFISDLQQTDNQTNTVVSVSCPISAVCSVP